MQLDKTRFITCTMSVEINQRNVFVDKRPHNEIYTFMIDYSFFENPQDFLFLCHNKNFDSEKMDMHKKHHRKGTNIYTKLDKITDALELRGVTGPWKIECIPGNALENSLEYQYFIENAMNEREVKYQAK